MKMKLVGKMRSGKDRIENILNKYFLEKIESVLYLISEGGSNNV